MELVVRTLTSTAPPASSPVSSTTTTATILLLLVHLFGLGYLNLTLEHHTNAG